MRIDAARCLARPGRNSPRRATAWGAQLEWMIQNAGHDVILSRKKREERGGEGTQSPQTAISDRAEVSRLCQQRRCDRLDKLDVKLGTSRLLGGDSLIRLRHETIPRKTLGFKFESWQRCNDRNWLTNYFLDDFRVLEFDIPQKRKYIVDDSRLIQPVDDLIQTGEDVQRQFQIPRIALEDQFGFGQHHLADHLVVQWGCDVGGRHQSRTLRSLITR